MSRKPTIFSLNGTSGSRTVSSSDAPPVSPQNVSMTPEQALDKVTALVQQGITAYSNGDTYSFFQGLRRLKRASYKIDLMKAAQARIKSILSPGETSSVIQKINRMIILSYRVSIDNYECCSYRDPGTLENEFAEVRAQIEQFFKDQPMEGVVVEPADRVEELKKASEEERSTHTYKP